MEKATRGQIGCVGVLVLFMLFNLINDAVSSRQHARMVAVRDSVQRVADSLSVLKVVGMEDGSARVDWVKVDALIHRRGFTLPHMRGHRAAIQALLDSTERLLRPGRQGWGDFSSASTILSQLPSPLTPAQQQRRVRLQDRIGAQSRRMAKAAQREAEQEMIEQRREFARSSEIVLLDQGMDFRVRTRGATATTIRYEWILASRVLAHQWSTDPALFPKLRQLGFRRIEIADGYGKSWYWTLD